MAVLTKLVGFVTTTSPGNAKAFYGDVLGFRLVDEDDFALVYDANGTMLAWFKDPEGNVLSISQHVRGV